MVPASCAHPGRTDANGGHYNRKTGEYHYHNGGYSGSSGGGGGSGYSNVTPIVLERSGFYYVRVLSVLAGDIVKVSFSDDYEPEMVKLVGCDSPILKTKTQQGAFYSNEARDYTTKSLKGKKVWLQISEAMIKDANSRILGYIWLTKPKTSNEQEIKTALFNSRLISNGCAQISTKYPTGEKYKKYFEKYQADAKSAKRGLWKNGK